MPGTLLLSVSGTFDVLTDTCIFILWIFFGMNGAEVFVLRRTHPEADRPYRVWGYPVVPALFLLVAVFLLINTLVATPWRGQAGLGLIALGLPIYSYFARGIEVETPQRLGGEENDG